MDLADSKRSTEYHFDGHIHVLAKNVEQNIHFTENFEFLLRQSRIDDLEFNSLNRQAKMLIHQKGSKVISGHHIPNTLQAQASKLKFPHLDTISIIPQPRSVERVFKYRPNSPFKPRCPYISAPYIIFSKMITQKPNARNLLYPSSAPRKLKLAVPKFKKSPKFPISKHKTSKMFATKIITFIRYNLCGHVVSPIDVDKSLLSHKKSHKEAEARFINISHLRCDNCIEEIEFWKAPRKRKGGGGGG
ncbi:hypothetical protein AA313_de0204723 [Arthrobotrys entomopaga]|nr:hypothetical protein AA313_de0204723 [Arthrobotrys entomopaga]